MMKSKIISILTPAEKHRKKILQELQEMQKIIDNHIKKIEKKCDKEQY